MDSDGIPLAFSINRGNMNEQLTLKPLEKKIISDFELSKFIVCTDAGLASEDNRKFNNKDGRAFITTWSIKKLKASLKKKQKSYQKYFTRNVGLRKMTLNNGLLSPTQSSIGIISVISATLKSKELKKQLKTTRQKSGNTIRIQSKTGLLKQR